MDDLTSLLHKVEDYGELVNFVTHRMCDILANGDDAVNKAETLTRVADNVFLNVPQHLRPSFAISQQNGKSLIKVTIPEFKILIES